MKFLTLIRHAKASPHTPFLTDFQRPLNPRGLRDAPLIGQHLRTAHHFSPDRLLTSPALRAATTADIILRSTGLSPDLLAEEPRIYEAPVSALMEVLRAQPDTTSHLALIGHNPGLELLANHLCGHPVIDALRTGGVIMLQLPIPSWSRAGPQTATLLTHFHPAQIGGGKEPA